MHVQRVGDPAGVAGGAGTGDHLLSPAQRLDAIAPVELGVHQDPFREPGRWHSQTSLFHDRLLPELDGPVELATDEPAVADDAKRGGPQRVVGRTLERDGVLGPADDLVAHPAKGKVAGGHGEAQRGVGVALGGGRPNGGAQVGEVTVEAVGPWSFFVGLHRRGRLLRDVDECRGVLGAHHGRFWTPSELLGTELA